MSKVRLIKIVGVALLVFIAVFLIGYTLLKLTGDKELEKTHYPQTEIIKNEESDNEINMLLLGYGGKGHSGGSLADVIILLNINNKEKKANLISIPRDLWVEIPLRSDHKEYFKINTAHAIGLDDKAYPMKEHLFQGKLGGGHLTKQVVKDATNFSIDYFVSINFGNFVNAIDSLNGIEVNVPNGFEDRFYPVKGLEEESCGFSPEKIVEIHEKHTGFDLEKQFECRYETLSFNKGLNHMDGATTLKFVRSRHSDTQGNDFARSERQMAVLEGIKNKLLSLEAIENYSEFIDQYEGMITTDFDFRATQSLIDFVGNVEEYEIKQIILNKDNVLKESVSSQGAYILIPKEGIRNYGGIQEYISNQTKN